MTFHEFKMREGCPATQSEPVDCSEIVRRLANAGIAEHVDVDQSQQSRHELWLARSAQPPRAPCSNTMIPSFPLDCSARWSFT